MSVVVVSGTGTGVGKTVATAALACHARLLALPVAVCKPVQTGTAPAGAEAGDDDLAEVGRLSGITGLHGLARYPEPHPHVLTARLAELYGVRADQL